MFQGISRTTVKFGDLLRGKCNVEFFAEVLEDFALFFKRKFFNLLQNLRCIHGGNLPLPNLHASDKWVLVWPFTWRMACRVGGNARFTTESDCSRSARRAPGLSRDTGERVLWTVYAQSIGKKT